MGLFHRHKWEKDGEPVYTPSPLRKVKGEFYDPAKIIFGFTSVVYQCECGKRKLVEHHGDVRSLL